MSHAHVHVHVMCMCMHMHMYMCMYMCMCACTCMYLCMCMCMLCMPENKSLPTESSHITIICTQYVQTSPSQHVQHHHHHLTSPHNHTRSSAFPMASASLSRRATLTQSSPVPTSD